MGSKMSDCLKHASRSGNEANDSSHGCNIQIRVNILPSLATIPRLLSGPKKKSKGQISLAATAHHCGVKPDRERTPGWGRQHINPSGAEEKQVQYLNHDSCHGAQYGNAFNSLIRCNRSCRFPRVCVCVAKSVTADRPGSV